MSNQRSWLWGVLIIAIIAAVWYRQSVFKAPPPPTTISVAFVTGGSDPYWQLTVAGARAAAEEYDAELDVIMPEQAESVAEQTQLLIGIDKDSVDGIAVSPLSAEAQTHLINQIVRTLPVVTFDSDAPLSNRQLYVGTSNYGAGQMCYKLIAEALPEGGQVAMLVATLSKDNINERKIGFEESLEEVEDVEDGKKVEIVAVLNDEGSEKTCRENIRQALADHSNLAGLVAMNGYHAPLVIEVLKDQGRLGDIKVVAFDDADETLAGIEDGTIYATVAQDPFKYGYEAVRMLTQLKAGKVAEVPIVGGGVVSVQCEAVRKDNLENHRKQLESRKQGAFAKPANGKESKQTSGSDATAQTASTSA